MAGFKKNGLSGQVNLSEGFPSSYSGTRGGVTVTIPFGPDTIKKPRPSIEANIIRQQGIGGNKFVPSLTFGAKYKYNIGKEYEGTSSDLEGMFDKDKQHSGPG
tara:strand:+ start:603 stop:911 length:309 start_codon:yes stop_codon:yes gene_type:complete